MAKAKPEVASLFRTKQKSVTRMDHMRLDMNEGVPGLPESFVRAVLGEIDSGVLSAYPEYGNLVEKLAERNGIEPENICLSNGSDAAIKYLFDAFISSGDRVLLTDPTFAMYPVYCQMYGAVAESVEFSDDFSFPLEKFLDSISGNVKMVVIVNPNNPTGTALSKKDIEKIILKAALNDTMVVVDEAYFYYYPETMIEYIKKYPNLVVLRTFSKLLGMASLRLGYAAAGPEIIESLHKVKSTYDVNGVSVLFAERLLDRQDIIDQMIFSANSGKSYLQERLSSEKIEVRAGNANFILVKCGARMEEIASKLEKRKILVSHGFRQSFLKDYLRITVADIGQMTLFAEQFLDIWRGKGD